MQLAYGLALLLNLLLVVIRLLGYGDEEAFDVLEAHGTGVDVLDGFTGVDPVSKDLTRFDLSFACVTEVMLVSNYYYGDHYL